MKSKDITKRYKTRFILNIIIAAFAACLADGLLIYNIGRLTSAFSEMSEPAVVLFNVVAALIIFSVIFYILQRRSLRYITKISDAMNDLSEGKLDTRLPVDGDDEFSGMAENLNRLGSELEKLLEAEREAEKSKTDLITNIAHDLKTPLTSIIGYLELLTGRSVIGLSDEQKSKYLKIAYNKSRRLEQLINDLFEFTKLSYGKMTMKAEYVDIVKLISQLAEEAYPNFKEKELTFELKTNVDSQEIVADGTLLARLFDNLIGNAVKYGADGKKIIVKINSEPENDFVEVKVINFGFVIDEKDIPLIFNKFYRADKARSTETGGTGLGLAIAKDIVDLHGGTIGVTSDLNGTVFTVRLKINFDKNSENLKRAGQKA